MRSIYWVRSDLRIHDNATLNNFCQHSVSGLIVWCPTSSYLRADSIRKQFIDQSINVFSDQLKIHGTSVNKLEKKMTDVLEELITIYQIDHVFWSKEFACEEAEEEKRVIAICNQKKISYTIFDQVTLIHPAQLPFEIKKMPLVFTDFRKSVEKNLSINDPLPPPKTWPMPIEMVAALAGTDDKKLIFPAGEASALARVQEYFWETDSVQTYKLTRNGMLNKNDSSKFSPWLNLGCLSPRHIYYELKLYEKKVVENESTYWLFFELLWRDYFKFLSQKLGRKLFLESGIDSTQNISTNRDSSLFNRWCNAKTGNSFIDANMNELNQTGWMSNRGRQNVASYLIHDLYLPWVWGAAYFEKKLIDYDPDCNWGNWLYLSGKGTDPRARKFNIEKQASQYDPFQHYEKKWLNR